MSEEQYITDIMLNLGVPAHLRGYRYLREAVLMSAEDMELVGSVTKLLYPEVAKKYKVTVATSDATEQVIIWGAGAMRMSAQGLLEEVKETNREIRRLLEEVKKPGKESMLKGLAPEVAELLEEVRLGKRTL